jgi:hypothetical protein
MVETPLQGFPRRGGDYPGRGPGLVYFAPLGLGIVRRPSQAVYPENRSSSGITASQEALGIGVPSFSKSSPRPPRLRVKMIPLRNFGVRV